jgi:hypothetical protein
MRTHCPPRAKGPAVVGTLEGSAARHFHDFSERQLGLEMSAYVAKRKDFTLEPGQDQPAAEKPYADWFAGKVARRENRVPERSHPVVEAGDCVLRRSIFIKRRRPLRDHVHGLILTA